MTVNRNLFKMEVRRNAPGLFLWMGAITLLICVTMAVYRPFLENQSKIMGMISIVPKEMLQFKGVSKIADLFSVLGFYAANNVIYMMVLGSIFAIVLASNILLKEEYNKTAEYLLTRPVTRSEIFLSKLSVLLLFVFLLNFVTAAAGFISMEIFKTTPFSIKAFMVLSLYTLLLNLLFGALGIFLSTLVKRAKPITASSIGLVLILYFIFTLSQITESVSTLGYISPFKYVSMDVVNPAYTLDPWHLLYFTGLSALAIAAAYRIYRHKDIYT
jgi:ABC-2 type transport system permease protein